MYYETSITATRNAITTKDSTIIAASSNLSKKGLVPLNHLLWMCDQIENLDTTQIKDAVKAGRWIGWIYRTLEEHGFFTNEEIRIISREDNIKNLAGGL